MIKVMTIFGTRPEAIKMAPLVKVLKARKDFECVVCITAQHREMLDQVLDAFAIQPDYDLNLMKSGQTLFHITSAALLGLNDVLQQAKPDMVLVHGDTTTTLAGTLAAFYLQIPIGHVEAGLRTWDKYSPFPEEMNRQMTDCATDLYFAPTQQSRENLLKENRADEKIIVTGNTAIDALSTTVRPGYTHPQLDWCHGKRLLLLTAHRRENWGEPLHRIFRAVRRIADEFSDVRVIYPVHMNPAVRQAADEELSGDERIRLIEPLNVLDFHNFMNAANLILTDSGGIQEEAPSLGKPVLVLRDTTERPEGVAGGTLRLVGTDEEAVYLATKELLCDRAAYAAMSTANNPYGDGKASARIADAIQAYFAKKA